MDKNKVATGVLSAPIAIRTSFSRVKVIDFSAFTVDRFELNAS